MKVDNQSVNSVYQQLPYLLLKNGSPSATTPTIYFNKPQTDFANITLNQNASTERIDGNVSRISVLSASLKIVICELRWAKKSQRTKKRLKRSTL